MEYSHNLRINFFLIISVCCSTAYASPYTLLNADKYRDTVTLSRNKISELLQELNPVRKHNADTQIAFIAHQLENIPYLYQNGMGEGDWQPSSRIYQPDAMHLNQNPVYRLDGLNCQTLVQVAMALYHSRSLAQFDQNYLKIAYGAAGNPDGEIVRYYNRNNFIDADFNPVNEKNGLLRDVTSHGALAEYSREVNANISRQQWFLHQRYQLNHHIQVLKEDSGPLMLERYKTIYTALPFKNFDKQEITMSYIPKENLVMRQDDNTYIPNRKLLDAIPTPAIAEIIRDPERWKDYGIKVKNILGTELTVSHLGLLYRQNFKQSDLIYQKTQCRWNQNRKKICDVTPVYCEKKSCRELMFTHATNAHPAGYYWYANEDGNFVCSPTLPDDENLKVTRCNRVVSLPFAAYLMDYQLGYYTNLDVPSILGVHVEKLG